MNHSAATTQHNPTNRSSNTMYESAAPSQHRLTIARLLRGSAAVALIASGLVGACSSGDNSKDASTVAERQSASASPTGSATGTEKGSAKGSAGESRVGAGSDLQGFSCDAAKSGVWSASGKVFNSTKKSATYTVDVAVASVKTSTVVGTATKTVTVEPGKTVSFTVPQVATRKGDGLACYPHVTRAAG
jgi:hypothetical protein